MGMNSKVNLHMEFDCDDRVRIRGSFFATGSVSFVDKLYSTSSSSNFRLLMERELL